MRIGITAEMTSAFTVLDKIDDIKRGMGRSYVPARLLGNLGIIYGNYKCGMCETY